MPAITADTAWNPVDLSPFWDGDVHQRLDAFAQIRQQADGVQKLTDQDGQNVWSMSSYHAVRAVSRDPETFSSAQGFSMDDFPPHLLEMIGSIIAMDAPKHRQYRQLVQVAFSPRAIRQMTDYVGTLTDAIIEQVRQEKSFDFVETVGAHLPFQVISDLLAIPTGDRARLRELIDLILGVDDADVSNPETSIKAAVEFFDYTIDLGNRRRSNPGDDITSHLMQAEVDGKKLTPQEFGSFVILLAAAGNDTTRTGLSWAVSLLSAHPEQKKLLTQRFNDLHGNAIEEVLRWSSPVLHMRRTATADTQLGDHQIRRGDKVIMWYLAANHDPAMFADPHTFDILRPNARDHLAFGAGGPHICLGSGLARMEMRVVLQKLFEHFPDLHATSAPEILRSQFVHGIKELSCSIR